MSGVSSRTVRAAPHPLLATVTVARWQTGSGVLYSTVVGKLTMQLGEGGKATLIEPEPLVLYDRALHGTSYVAEASELSPWTTVGSVVLYGGPLAFTIERAGEGPIAMSAVAGAAAGLSMTSPDRAKLARALPTRSANALLTIPDDLDGRYFLAAPPSQWLSFRGDEKVSLEAPGYRARRALPGMFITCTLDVGGADRTVSLVTDMIAVNAAARRISLVSRALVRGHASAVTHTIGPNAVADRGDVLGRVASSASVAPSQILQEETAVLGDEDLEKLDRTRDVSDLDLAALGAVAPFVLANPGEEAPDSRQAQAVPATPFDPGFAPNPVMPGVGVVSTMTPDEQMAEQLRAMRGQLRAERAQAAAPVPPPPVAPTTTPDSSPEAGQAPIAAPKAGAMAKPLFKRK